MSQRTWPIVIGGCHRSGTSLVRRVLNAHSAIHCGPEVKFFRDFYGDYAGDQWADFRFFATARTILAEGDLLEIAGAAFVAMHERAAARAGKRRWADKTPENVLHLAEWQRLLGDRWTFVHVVRHPLDTLASIKEARFARTIPANLDGRIEWYRRYTEAGLAFGAAAPDRCCRVIYESFVAAPDAGVRALMTALDEAPEAGQIAFNDAAQQAGLEDPKVSGTKDIHAESVGRWRDVLTDEEVRAIRMATDDLWRRIDPRGQTAYVART
jgi:hypothetical protein